MPNQLDRIPGDSNQADFIRQVNDNFGKLDNESITKAFKGPNQTNTLLQGRLPNDLGYGQLFYDPDGLAKIYMAIDANGDPVLKVAKDGYDATTAADTNLIFNSAQNTFKIASTGTSTITTTTAGGLFSSTTITHGLGVVPAVVAYYESGLFPGQYSSLPYAVSGISGGTVTYKGAIEYIVTSTTLTFHIKLDSTVSPNATWNFKYYLLTETAT